MIVLKRRNLVIISVLLLVAFTTILCFSALSKTPANNASAYKVKIVLDAGHGGIDGGVSGVKTGIKESQLNLAITKKLEQRLISAGFNVVLTRSSDAGLYGVATSNLKRKDMQKRKEIILNAKPDLVVSIHMNKFSVSSRRGAQVFYKQGDKRSKQLAESIQNCFNSMEQSTRNCSALTGDYYILNCSEYPAVIAECGFLSNPEDEALLLNEEYQNDLSYTLFKGIITYLSQSAFEN